MGNKTLWAMMTIVAMVALACGAPTASPARPASPAAPATGTARPPATGPAETEPTETEPAETEPAETEPAETEPAETEPPTSPGPGESPAAAVPSVPSGYDELDQALGSDQPFAGLTVSIQTQWIGGEGANFAAAFADFAAATGMRIQVDSIGSSHETVLRTRIEGGEPPDLAMLAQPTAVLAYGAEGNITDVSTIMDAQKLQDEHGTTIGLVSEGDQIWGIPYKADVKSTVWYPIPFFEQNNLAVPETWDEMTALEDQIIALGAAPWCMGMEAGTATGWQFTDWVEEIMLRTQTPDVYNQWITGDVKFNSPEVRPAFERIINLIYKEGNVLGGPQAVMSTPQTQPFDPAFPPDDNWDGFVPGCAMHKIPTWYGPDFFPDVRAAPETTPGMYEIGTDVGIFYLPMINEAQGTPALGSADTLMVLEDRPEVRAFAQFLSTPQGTQRWIETGSAISANTTTPGEWYEGFYKLDVAAEIVNNASYLGFDASDLMPPEVGAGAFWTESVNLVANGPEYLDTALQNIDAAWPSP